MKGWRGTRAAMRGIAADLGDARISELAPAGLRQWAESLLVQQYAPATVRQRCAIPKSALKLAHREQQLGVIPAFPTIRVDNARQSFFTRPEFKAVHAELVRRDPDAADASLFSYLTGWRKGEVLSLQWAWVDRAQGVIRLPDSKNDDGRVLPLVGELRDLIEKRWKGRALGVSAVFHRGGKPIKRMDRTWASACTAAGLPGCRAAGSTTSGARPPGISSRPATTTRPRWRSPATAPCRCSVATGSWTPGPRRARSRCSRATGRLWSLARSGRRKYAS